MHRLTVSFLIALAVPGSIQAQLDRVVFAFVGNGGDETGLAICSVGDVDDDGFEDVAVGAPGHDAAGLDAGRVTVYSGRDGRELFAIDGAAGDRLGIAVDGAGDVDRDGFGDLIIGSDAGYALVVSGTDRTPLATLIDPSLPSLGRNVAAVGDLDRDGFDDVMVAAPARGPIAGRVRIYSGRTAAVVHSFAGGGTGSTMAAAGDVDGDGIGDLVLGDPFASGAHLFGGVAEVRSGRDGHVLLTLEGRAPLESLGASVAAAGDVDRDGFDDLVVTSLATGAHVFAGRDGALLHTLRGERAGDQFGAVARSIGDVDGDGRSDLLIGAPGSTFFPSYARLYSGGGPTELVTLHAARATTGFAQAIAGADVDGDGFVEPLIGAPADDSLGVRHGAAFVYDVTWFGRFVPGRTVAGVATDRVGAAVAGIDDLDGDGAGEFVFTSPGDDFGGPDTGSIQIISGRGGGFLMTVLGNVTGGRLGESVAAAGDVDRDGRCDVVAGAPFDSTGGEHAGRVHVISPATSAPVRTFTGAPGARLGSAVAGDLDLDGDAVPDVIAGAPFDDTGGLEAGRVSAFSGRTSAVLWSITGTAAQRLGSALGTVGDVDGDGTGDLLVGGANHAALLSGHTGSVLHTWLGDTAGDRFGAAVAGLDDVDGDGTPDIAIAAPADDDGGIDAGRISVFSGRDGRRIRTIDGSPNDALGSALVRHDDLDGDSISELAAGAPGRDSVRVVSPVNGDVRAVLTGPGTGTRFGAALARVPDTNTDHIGELIVGAPEDRVDRGRATLHTSTLRADPGRFAPYGPACGLDGELPRIGLDGAAKIGGTFAFTLYAAPRGAPAALSVDVARSNLDLDLVGFPGCWLLAQPMLVFNLTTDAAGGASLAVSLSADRTPMIGTTVYAQWLIADLGRGRLAVSNGAALTFGYP